MTDPVPYEPAENIPPIVLWRQTNPPVSPGPFNAVEVIPTGDPPVLPTSVTFEIPVREYNLDDTVGCRVFVDVSASENGIEEELPPSGPAETRDRVISFQLPTQTGPLADAPRCHKVMVVCSDRGWKTGRVFYEVPEDEAGDPVTVPAFVQWLVWVDDGTGDPHELIGDCAGQSFPE